MRHVVITNQHGDNRGDEAALRATLHALEARLAPVRFTVLHQFADPDLLIEVPQDVAFVPLVSRTPRELLGLVVWSMRALLRGRPPDAPLGPAGRRIVAAYASADLVVSAPGGPYFGDLYWSHEVVHWWHVWCAARLGRPVFLYAPSAGPFRKGWLNWMRRSMFGKFVPPLTVREDVSRSYLEELLGDRVAVEATADAAFQDRVPPFGREDWFGPERAALSDRFVVAVSAIDFHYRGEPDPRARRRAHDDALRACMVHIHRQQPSHFVLLPQRYGAVHSDVDYLESLGRGLPPDVSWEVLDPSVDSNGHRRVIAMADLCIAGRYHPLVFAISAHVPVVCIYYEHKARGLAEEVGLSDLCVDIRQLDTETLLRVTDQVLERQDLLRDELARHESELRRRAARTSELATKAALAESVDGR
jgi:polysaccharide pyruvyl transferase WcaK-like protein